MKKKLFFAVTILAVGVFFANIAGSSYAAERTEDSWTYHNIIATDKLVQPDGYDPGAHTHEQNRQRAIQAKIIRALQNIQPGQIIFIDKDIDPETGGIVYINVGESKIGQKAIIIDVTIPTEDGDIFGAVDHEITSLTGYDPGQHSHEHNYERAIEAKIIRAKQQLKPNEVRLIDKQTDDLGFVDTIKALKAKNGKFYVALGVTTD